MIHKNATVLLLLYSATLLSTEILDKAGYEADSLFLQLATYMIAIRKCDFKSGCGFQNPSADTDYSYFGG